jgi:hypothetical protein
MIATGSQRLAQLQRQQYIREVPSYHQATVHALWMMDLVWCWYAAAKAFRLALAACMLATAKRDKPAAHLVLVRRLYAADRH